MMTLFCPSLEQNYATSKSPREEGTNPGNTGCFRDANVTLFPFFALSTKTKQNSFHGT